MHNPYNEYYPHYQINITHYFHKRHEKLLNTNPNEQAMLGIGMVTTFFEAITRIVRKFSDMITNQ